MDGEFVATYSTNNIWVDMDQETCLTTHLEGMESDITALETGKANANHTHANYAPLEHTHSGYAALNHTHSEYAAANHTHTGYASVSDVTALQNLVGDTAVSTQISTAVSGKADATHTHAIADITGLSTELSAKYVKPTTGIVKADLASDIQASLGKADTAVQSISGLATETYVNTQVSGKVDAVAGKGLSSNDYTDAEKTKLAGIEAGANNTVVDSALSSTSTNPVQNKIVNAAIDEINDLIGDNSVSVQISNAISGKANAVHAHAVADISGLSSTLSSKYEKPTTGILKTDLASDVQSSLAKADTAIQSLSSCALIAESNEFDGEQKFKNSEYCAILNDTANGVGCAFKATRALVNEALVDKLVITSTTGQMPIYTYSGTSEGSMTGLTRVGYIDASGNAVFNGTISATNIQDSVVEQGAVGNLRYQKWSSGKSEAWYSESLGTVELTSALANNVWSNTSCNARGVSLPSGLFSEAPTATCNVYSNGYTFSQISSASTTQLVYRIWSPYSTTISGCTISIHIIGKWK